MLFLTGGLKKRCLNILFASERCVILVVRATSLPNMLCHFAAVKVSGPPASLTCVKCPKRQSRHLCVAQHISNVAPGAAGPNSSPPIPAS